MKRVLAATTALALLCLGTFAQADVFNLGTGFTNLEIVAVGDLGNVGELSGSGVSGGRGPDRICGAVSYSYNIGKYEVTAKQYTEFLNNKAACDGDPHGLYNTSMMIASGCQISRSGQGTVADPYVYTVLGGWANRPVNFVSFWDSLRFANWLGNGQGNGDTETGAYTLNGFNGEDARIVQRNAGWEWAVASEDEWYKAAYYRGGGTDSGYWDYPMQSDSPTTPSNDITNPDGGNNANFWQNGYTIGAPWYRNNAGEFEYSESGYGTFDQGGNVWEWNESAVYEGSRGVRGGSFTMDNNDNLRASVRASALSSYEQADVGFRVVQAVPEPSSVIVLVGGLVSLLGIRRRRA